MLHYIAKKSTDILINNRIVDSTKEKIYVYGFELIWSFILYFTFASVVFSFCDWYDCFIAFLVFFIPIRITGGGYHANTYSGCFLLSNIVTFITILVSCKLYEYGNQLILGILKIVLVLLMVYIWKQVPVVPRRYSKNNRYIARNRKYSHILLVIYAILIIGMELMECNRLQYTAIITLLMVALLIFITKRRM